MGTVDCHKYRELRASTPRGHLLPPTSFLQKPLRTTMVDKSRNLPGAHHRHLLQLRWWLLPELSAAPPRGPPSTSSSTSVVDAAGATSSTSQGARHRRLLQLWLWLLSKLQAAPLRGSAIDVFFNFGIDYCWSYRHHLLGGSPSTSSSTLVVAAAGATGNTPGGQPSTCG
jgi:hypothetical protein